jgi:integrase
MLAAKVWTADRTEGIMARAINRLSALKIEKAKRGKLRVGLHADGLGLYLKQDPGGSASWVFRYRVAGRLRDHGLGPLHTVSLADAREKALACRKLRLEGVDPIADKHAKRAAARAAEIRTATFDQCVNGYLRAHAAEWRPQSAKAWRQSMDDYVLPALGSMPVAMVDTAAVKRVLEPIWNTAVTGSRVRGRIERVLDYARAAGLREGDNPARWKGHLDHLLAPPRAGKAVEHHAAIDYRTMPGLMAALASDRSDAARCVQLLILTATRRDEAREASWGEIDLKDGVWTIPASRMKVKQEHRIPLSPPALALLKVIRAENASGRLFSIGKHAPARCLKRYGVAATVHGMRSAFRTWCADVTSFPSEIAEAALAHRVGDATQRAYQRGSFFDRRRALMEAWGSFCVGSGSGITALVPVRARSA